MAAKVVRLHPSGSIAATKVVNDREEEFEEALEQRIKAAMRLYRNKKGWNQQVMADFLDISKDNYQKYEQSSPRPSLRKVPKGVMLKFCERTGQDPFELLRPLRKRAANG